MCWMHTSDSPVAREHHPRRCGSIHIGKVIDYPMILLGATGEVVLCTHHNKVNLTIIKSKPGTIKSKIQLIDFLKAKSKCLH